MNDYPEPSRWAQSRGPAMMATLLAPAVIAGTFVLVLVLGPIATVSAYARHARGK